MKAFHGDPAVKEKYLARLRAHHEADEIVQGTGYDGSHGCAVGCTLNKYDHWGYENELGLPQWLAHLEDRIFEGLLPKDAQQFAVDFLESVPVGADVSGVRWQLASQRHHLNKERFSENTKPYADQLRAALDLVIAYCNSEIKTESARSAARSAAWSAAESAAAEAAAESAAWSAESAAWSWSSARSAAWSAAESAAAEAAAESAAWSAWSAESAAWSWSSARSAESAAWSSSSSAAAAAAAARYRHFKWEAKTLLKLLRAAPVVA